MWFVALVFVVTVYVPDAGGINGSAQAADRLGLAPYGHLACGPSYPKGAVFVFDEEPLPGTARVWVCRDRGGLVGNQNLDLCLRGPNAMAQARAFGRRRLRARVYPSLGAYQASRERLSAPGRE